MVDAWTASPAFRPLHSTRVYTSSLSLRQNPKPTTTTTTTLSSSTLSSSSSSSSSLVNYQELKSLALEIARHDELYYSEAGPELSDDDYDALVAREAHLCQDDPSLAERLLLEEGIVTRYGNRVGTTAAVPTRTLDSTSADTEKRVHGQPMLSLDNAHNEEQVLQWIGRLEKKAREQIMAMSNAEEMDNSTVSIQLLTEPKLDGLSLSLHYQRTKDEGDSSSSVGLVSSVYRLVWAATRGDGKQGQDVTEAVLDMACIPTKLLIHNNKEDVVEIRGEVVLPRTAFDKFNADAATAAASVEQEKSSKEGDGASSSSLASQSPLFSNPRNAAAGLLLRKKTQDQHRMRKELQFYAYDVVGIHHEAKTSPNDDEDSITDALGMRAWLQQYGFLLPEPHAVSTVLLPITTSNTTNNETTVTPDISNLMEYHEALYQHKQGNTDSNKSSRFVFDDYDMDGCVHKVTDLSFRSVLGSSTRYPRWAIAHKFPTTTSMTALLDIVVQVGRTGALTPVAILEPVDIQGVLVQKATLHNFKHLQETLLSSNETEMMTDNDSSTGRTIRIRKGTKVLVRRAGEVIPQVVQRVFLNDDENDDVQDDAWISLDAPAACPACGSPAVWEDSTSDVGQVLRCGGPALKCKPRVVTGLMHAFSRDALDVKGLSQARIEQLMDAELLPRPGDLFRLVPSNEITTSDDGLEQQQQQQQGENTIQNDDDDEDDDDSSPPLPSSVFADQIAELPGWGPKSVENLRKAVIRIASATTTTDKNGSSNNGNNNNGVSLGRYLFSLGIRHMGQHSSELVAAVYGNKNAFLNALQDAQKAANATEAFPELWQETDSTKGIGPVLVQSLHAFAQDEELVETAQDLANRVYVHPQETVVSTSEDNDDKPWSGFRVVFTGTLPGMSRSEGQKLAKTLLGATSTPNTVSASSTSIVVVGVKGGKKSKQAEELGVPILSGEDFVRLVEETQKKENET